ncbi:MAG: VapC toxin family PIN domain ribonuclease [Acidobacteriota bacterium]
MLERHHRQSAHDWFASAGGKRLGICPLTEAGFLRVATHPAFHPSTRTLEYAIVLLQALKGRDDCWYCPMDRSWAALTARFADRIRGHQQLTDAYLLGLAIQEEGVPVTFDLGMKYMAGAEFSRNRLIGRRVRV